MVCCIPSPAKHVVACRCGAEQTDAPLLEAVAARAARREAAFHVPGHKRGAGVDAGVARLIGKNALSADLTELSGLDYLASPRGPIANAERLAASAFGADRTFLLINGSTGGIHAAVLATCAPDDVLVLARNAHQSAVAAAALAGVRIEWAEAAADTAGLGIAHGVDSTAAETALVRAARRGRVCAMLVVSPTYFGACSDVLKLSNVAHEHGVPLIVDEAHGAHLAFSEDLPVAAMAAGADIAVQSTHKTLGAMTQASMLHLRRGRVSEDRVARALQIVQSSSPSYLLMAALDGARRHAVQTGVVQQAVELSRIARRRLEKLDGLRIFGSEPKVVDSPGIAAIDLTRITVDVAGLGLTGYACAKTLEDRFGVVSELSTGGLVVFVLTPGNGMADVDQLVGAFSVLASERAFQNKKVMVPVDVLPPPEFILSPRDAFFCETEKLVLGDAVGRIAAELVCTYPPGIPAIVPGGRITSAAIAQLQQCIDDGGTVTGLSDQEMGTLAVCKGIRENSPSTLSEQLFFIGSGTRTGLSTLAFFLLAILAVISRRFRTPMQDLQRPLMLTSVGEQPSRVHKR